MLRACMSYIRPALFLMKRPGFTFASEVISPPTQTRLDQLKTEPNIIQMSKNSPLFAIWAERVNKQIREFKRKNKNPTMPLIDYLQKIQLESAQMEILNKMGFSNNQIKHARSIYMKALDIWEGIQVPDGITSTQERFKNALNPNNKITFYPNSFVTPTIFDMVYDISRLQGKVMTLGRPGISKSMAYIFSYYNSSISTAYRYHNIKMAEELVKLKLLDNIHSKVLFTNFDFGIEDLKNFSLRIVEQCGQIKQKLDQTIETLDKRSKQRGYTDWSPLQLEDFLIQLKYFYLEKSIKTIIVMDQINTLARHFTQYNKFKASLSTVSFQQLTINFPTLQKENFKRRAIFRHGSILLGGCIYNSSSNIEPQMLQPANESKNLYLTMKIFNQQQFRKVICEFNPNYIKDSQKKEICRHIWYETAKFLFNQLNTNSQNKEKIEKIFLKECDKLSEKQFSSFVTPVSIRLKVKKSKLPNLTQSDIGKYVQSIFEDIREEGLKLQKDKSTQFISLKEMKRDRLKVAMQCWYQIQKDQNAQFIQVGKASWFSKYATGAKCLLPSLVDKDLFQFQDQRMNKLRLLCSGAEILEIYDNLLDNFIYQPDILEDFQKALKDPLFLGHLLQKVIVGLIQKYSECIFSTDSFWCLVSSTTQFTHLARSANVYMSLFKVFNIAEKNRKGQFCFAKPVKYGGDESQNSPSIDLIGVCSVNNKGEFQVVSFDFTVASQAEAIKEKIQNFTNLINSKLEKQSQSQVVKVSQSQEKMTEVFRQVMSIISKWTDKKQPAIQIKLFLGLQKISPKNSSKNKEIAAKGKELLKDLENNPIILNFKNEVRKIVQKDNTDKDAKQQILSYYVKQNILKMDELRIIKKWSHFIICNEKHCQNQKLEQSFESFGVKVSIKMAKLSSILVKKTGSATQTFQTTQSQGLLKNLIENYIKK